MRTLLPSPCSSPSTQPIISERPLRLQHQQLRSRSPFQRQQRPPSSLLSYLRVLFLLLTMSVVAARAFLFVKSTTSTRFRRLSAHKAVSRSSRYDSARRWLCSSSNSSISGSSSSSSLSSSSSSSSSIDSPVTAFATTVNDPLFHGFSHSMSEFATHIIVQDDSNTSTVEALVQLVLVQARRRPGTKNNEGNNKNNNLNNLLTARDLIDLGAVWFLPAGAPRGPALGGKPVRLDLAQCQKNQVLNKGDYFRIHHNPRRFPNVYQYNWSKFINDDDSSSSTTSSSLPVQLPGVIVAQDPTKGWLVIDKPAQVPVHMTVDNRRENVAACLLQEALKQQQQHQKNGRDEEVEEDVYVSTPQRLDQNTSGLMVVATKKEFANYFATLLQFKTLQQLEGATTMATAAASEPVHKLYRCLVCLTPPSVADGTLVLGSEMRASSSSSSWSVEQATSKLQSMAETGEIMRHYLEPSIRAPKRFVVEPPPPPPTFPPGDAVDINNSNRNNWQECLLRIQKVSPAYALIGNEPGDKLVKALWVGDDDGERRCSRVPPGVQAVVELEVDLLTGRTHQIRGQLSAAGFPLVGDSQYGGAIPIPDMYSVDRLALQCCELEFLDPDIVHKANGTMSMARSRRWNRFRLESGWWTSLLGEYKKQSTMLSADQRTASAAAADYGVNIPEPTESTSSTSSVKVSRPDLLPPRVSLSPGRNKYVLIRADPVNSCTDTDTAVEWFVKSASPHECGGPYHGNVAQDLREWIEAAGFKAKVTGGGRIYFRPDENSAVVYGFSYGFGRGDHAHAAALIRKAGIDATVDNSHDLY